MTGFYLSIGICFRSIKTNLQYLTVPNHDFRLWAYILISEMGRTQIRKQSIRRAAVLYDIRPMSEGGGLSSQLVCHRIFYNFK